MQNEMKNLLSEISGKVVENRRLWPTSEKWKKKQVKAIKLKEIWKNPVKFAEIV